MFYRQGVDFASYSDRVGRNSVGVEWGLFSISWYRLCLLYYLQGLDGSERAEADIGGEDRKALTGLAVLWERTWTRRFVKTHYTGHL